MTRDFFAYGDLFNNGLPFPGWSFRMSGLEKWPIIKFIAKSASLRAWLLWKRDAIVAI